MPKAKYAEIYKDLKRKIETGEYEFQELLPSENTLVQEYDCSRNTIRRAIGDLVADGYVQTMQGKGVRIIFQPALQTSFTIGLIETFTESAKRNNQKAKTKVIHFAKLVVDKRISGPISTTKAGRPARWRICGTWTGSGGRRTALIRSRRPIGKCCWGCRICLRGSLTGISSEIGPFQTRSPAIKKQSVPADCRNALFYAPILIFTSNVVPPCLPV